MSHYQSKEMPASAETGQDQDILRSLSNELVKLNVKPQDASGLALGLSSVIRMSTADILLTGRNIDPNSVEDKVAYIRENFVPEEINAAFLQATQRELEIVWRACNEVISSKTNSSVPPEIIH